MRRLHLTIAAAATILSAACTADVPTTIESEAAPSMHTGEHSEKLSPAVLAELAQVRRATARFHDIDKAFEAGYTVWSPNPFVEGATCATSPAGKMGYHLVNTSLRGSPANPAEADAELDPMRPEMLLYEKRADGKLHLVGVEYLVFKAAWERENGAAAPQLLGQTVPFSSHPFPPAVLGNVDHYELHVWLWKPNPNGMFSHWNPDISC